jgi:succinate dehydrogenase hydrophobic anchor subunit
MLGIIYIFLAIWLIYMATTHPTEQWTLDGKNFSAPRIVVFLREFVQGKKTKK